MKWSRELAWFLIIQMLAWILATVLFVSACEIALDRLMESNRRIEQEKQDAEWREFLEKRGEE